MKINAILLSLLLVLPTFGVAIEKHFCGGYLADVALFGGAGCGCDDNLEVDNCCHEEEQVFQLDEDQIGSSNKPLPKITEHDILAILLPTLPADLHNMEDSQAYAYDLPPPRTVPSYLLNCSFTFYG